MVGPIMVPGEVEWRSGWVGGGWYLMQSPCSPSRGGSTTASTGTLWCTACCSTSVRPGRREGKAGAGRADGE